MDCPEEHDSKKRELLAGFHKTISEQLNARLEESPRFFWALVVVSTGYGYVLWNLAKNPKPGLCVVFVIASLLSYVAVLWASWYLAALGYAFRYLQYGQHCIEQALGWNAYVPIYGKPPARFRWWRCSKTICKTFCESFWLLPGIYHAHVFGLVSLLVIIIVAFCCYSSEWLGICCVLLIGFISFVIGVGFIIFINRYYVQKYKVTYEKARKEARRKARKVTDPTPSVETGGAPSTAQ